MPIPSDITTEEAFRMLVNSDYYWSLTGRPHRHKRVLRRRVKIGEGISLDKKEELLFKAGFGVKQEKIWKLPE